MRRTLIAMAVLIAILVPAPAAAAGNYKLDRRGPGLTAHQLRLSRAMEAAAARFVAFRFVFVGAGW